MQADKHVMFSVLVVQSNDLDESQRSFPSKTEAENTTSQCPKGKAAWPRDKRFHIKGTGDYACVLLSVTQLASTSELLCKILGASDTVDLPAKCWLTKTPEEMLPKLKGKALPSGRPQHLLKVFQSPSSGSTDSGRNPNRAGMRSQGPRVFMRGEGGQTSQEAGVPQQQTP